jgi:hypothetical protein
MEKKLIAAVCIMLTVNVLSGGQHLSDHKENTPSLYSRFDADAMLYLDGKHLAEYIAVDDNSRLSGRKKSPFLAGVLSLAIPGSGEIYSGNYWQAAMHVAFEVAGWYFYLYNQTQGNEKTDIYKDYANGHWSVVRYADWLNTYWLDEAGAPSPIFIDPDESKNPWQRVNWEQIHTIERGVRQFSHTLEPYGTQQYFELIGKYPQYNRGWSDSIPYEDAAIERIRYFDEISEMFSAYSGLRGRANTYYGRAHTFALVIFLNHFVSAFHAAFLAHRFNEAQLAIDMEHHPTPFGVRTNPVLKLQVGF